jgi:hypothetical protein
MMLTLIDRCQGSSFSFGDTAALTDDCVAKRFFQALNIRMGYLVLVAGLVALIVSVIVHI